MSPNWPPANRGRFENALRRFDEENARDPHQELVAGTPRPRELVYAQWLSEWVVRLEPDASEALRLAARSAHLCRWTMPRDRYPMDRTGYLRWRAELKTFHAQKAGEILRESGYDAEMIERVQGLISKRAFPADPQSRVLEDALCLVFLEHQLGDLAAKSGPEKVINALQKSWKKMTPLGREKALQLAYSPREQELLGQALGST